MKRFCCSMMNLRTAFLPVLLLAFSASMGAPSAVKVPPDVFFTRPQFTTRFEFASRGVGQHTAETFLDEIVTNGFPCGVYVVECDWATHPGAMTFDTAEFPDPAGLFGKIRDAGATPLLSASCFVSPDSRECRRFRFDPEGGGLDHLLHGPDDRTPAIIQWRGGGSAVWDLTRPAAFGFFLDMLTSFAEKYRVEGFLFESFASSELAGCRFFSQNADADAFFSCYGRLARYFPCSFYDRAMPGFLGATVRLSPRRHSWTDLQRVIPEMLALSGDGTLFCVPDGVGGGDTAFVSPSRLGRVDQTLFVRSCAMQAMMPAMQFARAPWRSLSPENTRICNAFVRLHASMAPYILEQVRHAARTGEPVVRSMDKVFPRQGFDRPLQQFMLGPKYLVAPVVSQDGSVVIEFPAGIWTDPRGMTVEGPKSLSMEKVPLSFLPYFERKM